MKTLEFFFETNSDTRHLAFLRQVFPIIATLRGVRLGRKDTGRLTLMLIEAYNNAHFHAHQKNHKRKVGIGIRVTPARIRLQVTDQGKGIIPKNKKMPPGEALHGRGLAILKAHSEKLVFRRTRSGHQMEVWYRYGK